MQDTVCRLCVCASTASKRHPEWVGPGPANVHLVTYFVIHPVSIGRDCHEIDSSRLRLSLETRGRFSVCVWLGPFTGSALFCQFGWGPLLALHCFDRGLVACGLVLTSSRFCVMPPVSSSVCPSPSSGLAPAQTPSPTSPFLPHYPWKYTKIRRPWASARPLAGHTSRRPLCGVPPPTFWTAARTSSSSAATATRKLQRRKQKRRHWRRSSVNVFFCTARGPGGFFARIGTRIGNGNAPPHFAKLV